MFAARDGCVPASAIEPPSPFEGPQEDFLSSPERDVLYGGAAGGGKSFSLLADPLRYCHNPNHRGLLLRRTLDELTELIDKSRQLYTKAFPGARFRESKSTWVKFCAISLKQGGGT